MSLKLRVTRTLPSPLRSNRRTWSSAAEESSGNFTRLRLRTDPDGTTYLQFGLVGPGWGWVQNRLVVSWSPGAVRLNKPAASRVTSSAFASPAGR
jgi:hypothetical protein